MSSTVSEGFVPGRKLLVHIAENGRSLELECNESTMVEEVKRSIESVAGILATDQLLLCLDMKLESQQPLSAYKLPSDDREVFLYNRARLSNNAPPPVPEQVDIPEIAEPPFPVSNRSPHPLDNAKDPALIALPGYEQQFRYHFQQGRVIYDVTALKFQNCERLVKEQKVQERALETAKGSMDHYYRMVQQMYKDFMRCYTQQHKYHTDLLANCARDIEKLRSCKLHPSLQTETQRCLLDFVKEENLWKWAENCNSLHRQFEAKVSQLKQVFSDLKRSVEDLFSAKANVSIRDMELTINQHRRYLNEQRSIMQSLNKDVNTVKKLVDDCVSSQLPESIRPSDAVSALGPMYDVHEKNHLPKMGACDSAVTKLLDFCRKNKNEVNVFVHNCMQKVAYVQFDIKDFRLQFPAFKEAMARQDDQFADLKLIRGIGSAYRACLAEVVRRKASMKIYMGMAGQLAEKLAGKREAEVRRREEFIKAQSAYIPKDILSSLGLFDTPSQCDVNIAPFDTNLLEIDIPDIERYAPESLVPLSYKAEKHGLSKDSVSMSNDGSQLAEAEECSVDTSYKYDLEGLDEDCESIVIAGTSKLEVENARLKAELASAIAFICAINPEIEYESLDDSRLDSLLKNTAEKTTEALHLKDQYGNHLQFMLKEKEKQCLSYEKRIQELEQRLSTQYLQGQKLTGSKDRSEPTVSAVKSGDCKSEISGEGGHLPYTSTEPMDAVSFTSATSDTKLEQFCRQLGKAREGVDENMCDSSGLLNQQLDSSMLESHEGLQVTNDGENKFAEQLSVEREASSVADVISGPLSMVSCGTVEEPSSNSKVEENLIRELQIALADKSDECTETETKFKAVMEEVVTLRRELEISKKLLDESQMNCAHLENCLHEAREETHTHICASERRSLEYNALRASAVKMQGLFDRLRDCVTVSGGITKFVDSFRDLAESFNKSANETQEDGLGEFRKCIQVLADRVSVLSQHRAELLQRSLRAEECLKKELEEKKQLLKNLYAKHQLEKQANKEKISFGRFEVQEIAAFVLNYAGHYEAVNRNCSNYYLSTESVALFVEQQPNQPKYIIGQIVHIERQIVKPLQVFRSEHAVDQGDHRSSNVGTSRLSHGSDSTSNPYGLPMGSEYFIVTIAMLPDTMIHSSTPS